MKAMKLLENTLALAAAVAVASCSLDTAPSGDGRAKPGDGPTVRWDMAAKPLPDIPLPNDLATWPDPTSRTGLRVNASLIAPTSIERDARERMSRLEGWGTFSAITLSFDRAADATDATEAAVSLAALAARHQHDDYDFANDAVYLVNLKTGVPVPLDLGEGAFNPILKRLDKYWANDPRATEENTLFETYDETWGKPPGTKYAPELDTDFDGVLDRPNLDVAGACASAQEVAGDAAKTLDRQRCVADHLLTWYERQTDTLIMRPVVPLDEMTEYAVVVTDRVVDAKGRSVRSSLDYVYPPSQERSIAKLRDVLADGGARKAYFGDIGGTGLAHVAFSWTFTTEPTVSDMLALRDGLYGQGAFGYLASQFPAKLKMARAVGLYTQSDIDGVLASGAPMPTEDEQLAADTCQDKKNAIYVIQVAKTHDLLTQIVEQVFGFSGTEEKALLSSWEENLEYIAVGTYESPFFVEGGPKGTDPHAGFHMDVATGQADLASDTVQFWLLVPKAQNGHTAPFDVSFYGHGYTGNSTEGFLYAGLLARQGIATVGINAVGHGLTDIDAATLKLAQLLFKGSCLGPTADALVQGRARDLNDDGRADSGGDFWTSYLFHTRDVVRQSVIDHLQLSRILRTFDGKTMSEQDFNSDGKPDLAGDFNGDGTPDVGGPDAKMSTWGQSLGAFLSAVHGAIDPNISAAAPTSGGAMIDVGVRTFQGGVVEAVTLRMLGPLLVGRAAASLGSNTRCAATDTSLQWILPDLNGTAEIELGCASATDVPPAHATLIAYNLANHETRCARVGEGGAFRIGLPSSKGDPIELHFYREVDFVDGYGTCKPKQDRAGDFVVKAWGKGPVAKNSPHPTDPERVLCTNAASCTEFQGMELEEGAFLTSPGDGYGFFRQSPDLRRMFGIAQAILDPADSISYMPFFGLRTLPDPYGKPMPPRGLMDIQTIGDMNVPISAGIELGRAAGALPFFTAEQAAKYPEWADHATPTALVQAFGGKTPSRVLVDEHVVEGIDRLERHPVALGACGVNERPTGTSDIAKACHKACTTDDDCGGARCSDPNASDTCRVCEVSSGQCVTRPTAPRCNKTLFDPDVLAEGKQLFGAASAKVPLRLARLSGNATPTTIDDVWAPRLLGVPGGADGAWTPSAPLVSILDAMIEPNGTHTFTNPLPCKNFDESAYLTLVVGQFFRTGGRDLYYLSHPSTHHCLESLSCPAAAGQ